MFPENNGCEAAADLTRQIIADYAFWEPELLDAPESEYDRLMLPEVKNAAGELFWLCPRDEGGDLLERGDGTRNDALFGVCSAEMYFTAMQGRSAGTAVVAFTVEFNPPRVKGFDNYDIPDTETMNRIIADLQTYQAAITVQESTTGDAAVGY